MPKVSIILPVLNSVKYIRECMDSIITQNLKDIEIIPVDAGSTDGTREILEEYAKNDNRVNLLYSEKKSVGFQYNLGIAAAKGEYIGFVESDDYIVPEMYEILFDNAEKNKVDWIKANYCYFLEYPNLGRQMIPINDEKFCKTNEVFDPHVYPKQYIQEIFMWRGIYKTEFIKSHKIILNETPGAAFQDTGFILQAFMFARRALYIDDCLYCYRRDNESSSSHQANTIRYEIDEVEYISEIIKREPELYQLFWKVNYIRAMGRFMSAYQRVPENINCPMNILHAVQRYRQYLLDEIQKNIDMEDLCLIYGYLKEILWLKEGLEVFDKKYREIDSENEKLMRSMLIKILNYKKIIIFGCGDNGSGIISLLLRLNRNKIISLSDNDKKKWNKTYMGIMVIPPEKLEVDKETIILIANGQCFFEIRAQLIALGIPEQQIQISPPIMRYRGTNLLIDNDVLPLR